MMKHAGRGGPARHGGDAGRDRYRGDLPAAAAGSAVPALWYRDGGAREPLPRPLAPRLATSLVPGVRLGRRGAPGAAGVDAGLDPLASATAHGVLIRPSSC